MLSDHGLDSLDAIELVIKIEDELGYVIDAENLEKFKKPIHYVNFIKHMEAYKEEHSKLPHEDTKATMYTMEEAFPGVPLQLPRAAVSKVTRSRSIAEYQKYN